MRRFVLAIALALFALPFAALPGLAAADLPPAMVNVTWELVTMQAAGRQPENTAGTGLTIVFSSDGTVSGYNGCNQFTSSYTVANEGTLGFKPFASTLRACAEAGVAEREARYMATLKEVGGFVLDSQTSMRLTFPQQGLQLVYRRGAPTLPATGGGGMAPATNPAWPPAAIALAVTLIALGSLRVARRAWRP